MISPRRPLIRAINRNATLHSQNALLIDSSRRPFASLPSMHWVECVYERDISRYLESRNNLFTFCAALLCNVVGTEKTWMRIKSSSGHILMPYIVYVRRRRSSTTEQRARQRSNNIKVNLDWEVPVHRNAASYILLLLLLLFRSSWAALSSSFK